MKNILKHLKLLWKALLEGEIGMYKRIHSEKKKMRNGKNDTL